VFERVVSDARIPPFRSVPDTKSIRHLGDEDPLPNALLDVPDGAGRIGSSRVNVVMETEESQKIDVEVFWTGGSWQQSR
jgi:hypothetical protein